MDLIGLVGNVFPRFGLRYLAARRAFREARLYEAAQPSQYRPALSNLTSGDGVMSQTGDRLRQLSRHLEENHDLVVAIFDDIVNNTLGDGVKAAPMVRKPDGSLATKVNDYLSDLWDEWSQYPETTGDFSWQAAERMAFRSELRDGEVFAQHVLTASNFRYRTRIPYALELIEADLVPFTAEDRSRNILHGIENNQWNSPVAYWLLKNHPGDPLTASVPDLSSMKRMPAESMIHLKFTRRLRQRRGIPVIHAVINRMRDVKDYEESERIAAKVAADATGFIKRTSEYQGPEMASGDTNRTFQMSAGTIFNLIPGEEMGLISADRPNTNLVTFREAMLRAVAGGTGSRFSSISRNYNGTYSAQRQELVEGAIAYRAHFAYLCSRWHRPVYANFIRAAKFAGLLDRLPESIDSETLQRVDFRAPALPWIDPSKEADAYRTLVEAGLESRQEIMRQRGRDPAKVWEEIEEEMDAGLFDGMVSTAQPDNPDTQSEAA